MIDVVANALASVKEPRFYETERGFQGELLALIHAALPDAGLPGDPIVEQEYQKRFHAHRITLRPDIIVHIPTPVGGDRRRGNFLVCELKLAAQPDEARDDFASLDAVIRELDYPLGVFVNIASADTHAQLYRGAYPDRIHCFAVHLIQQQVRVRHARFNGTRFVE